MDEALKLDIIKSITSQEGFKLIQNEALNIFKGEPLDDCFSLSLEFYKSDYFQVQQLGVFLMGHTSYKNDTALKFLKETVSQNTDWRVQEILAMAFDSFCKANGYENSLPIIEEWLSCSYANTRRAVTEGLRIWTSRPYFKDHPEKAIDIISPLRNDESEYVRRSAGNALKDISKKHGNLVVKELETWDLSIKSINQVYKLANKHLIKLEGKYEKL